MVVEQIERVAKSKRGLQGGSIAVEAALSRVGVPGDGPEAREVAPMSTPKTGAPLRKIEVPERVVDAGRFPIEDARELTADDEELVLVDVAMDEDVSMPSAPVG